MKNVNVYRISDYECVASHSAEEAIQWYKNLTGCADDEIFSLDEIEVVSPSYKVRKGEDEEGMITTQEIVEFYWRGEPFIAISSD